jgi:hypothetical protein
MVWFVDCINISEIYYCLAKIEKERWRMEITNVRMFQYEAHREVESWCIAFDSPEC